MSMVDKIIKQFSAVSGPLNRGPRTAALSNTPLKSFAHVPYRETFSDNKILPKKHKKCKYFKISLQKITKSINITL